MHPKSVVIVYADTGDWMGVYDTAGALLHQGHNVEPDRLLQIVGVTHTSCHDVDLGNESRLPDDYHELPMFGGSWGKPPRLVERDWCDQCKDDPAGQRWLCRNRPHPAVEVA
jgi:hypothetical protein